MRARVLFLLNDPGAGALQNSGGTGMLSMINRDPTTTRQLKALHDSGLDRRMALHWNAIPWPVAESERNRQVPEAVEALAKLLDVLSRHGGELRGVVTLGIYARKVWTALPARPAHGPALQHHTSAHPAARGAGVQDQLNAAHRWAAAVATT